jgi:hypothetical protein
MLFATPHEASLRLHRQRDDFYSAEEFWDMDKEAFERFVGCAFRPDRVST